MLQHFFPAPRAGVVLEALAFRYIKRPKEDPSWGGASRSSRVVDFQWMFIPKKLFCLCPGGWRMAASRPCDKKGLKVWFVAFGMKI